MKKGIALCAAAALALPAAVSAQEAAGERPPFELSFSNEVGSDVVSITEDGAAFAGLYDEVIVDVASEKVDAGIDAEFRLYAAGDDGAPNKIDFDDFDWYVVFRPIQALGLGVSQDIWLSGSYLFIEDDNVAGGNIGSDGFTASFSGVPGLTLAATVPFPNAFGESDGGTDCFNFGLGAEYSINGIISIGASASDIFDGDGFGLGAFVGAFPTDGLSILCGYSYRSEGMCGVEGDHLFNASALYETGAVAAAFDFVSSEDMMYGAVQVDVGAGSLATVSGGVAVNAWYDGDLAAEAGAPEQLWTVKPACVFAAGGHHEFSVEMDVSFTEDGFDSICFPVYWLYRL